MRTGSGLWIAVYRGDSNQGVKNNVKEISTNKGARVRFRISDVFLPSLEELGLAPPPETEVEGAIVLFSDSGLNRHAFAVVELDTEETMVVPVEKLKLAARRGSSRSRGR
jgi:hypothetical protein